MSTIPIYEAQSFVRRITKGGRTKPLVVTALVNQKPTAYIVKLYSKKEVSEGRTVSKEILGAVLAKQFDLQVPEPAFIRFGSKFLSTLDEKLRMEIESKDTRLKYGCEYIESSYTFNKNISKNILEKYLDTDTIFAFDNMICNVDRRFDKPNLLVHEACYHLIDHEYGFSMDRSIFDEIRDQQWTYPVKRHLFYKFLKSRSLERKKRLFETFEAYLAELNPRVLKPYFQQLNELHHSTTGLDFLEDYLYFLKENSSKFVTLLRGLLQ